MLGSAFSFAGYAQVLTPDLPANRNLILAEEQYKQEHYSLAEQSAKATF
jgi:hypothetical protein